MNDPPILRVPPVEVTVPALMVKSFATVGSVLVAKVNPPPLPAMVRL